MSNTIQILCPSCKLSFEAPSLYLGKQVNCIHCKASIVANDAPPIVKPAPPKSSVVTHSSFKLTQSKTVKSDTLWKKLNSFRFKELTRNEILICSGVILFLVVCLIFDPPNKSGSKRKSKASSISNTNSGLTPSHYPVVSYIKETAKDPSSIEIINYSEVEKVKDGVYRIRVIYRGKNGFGGYSREDKIFYLKEADGYWDVTPN